MEDWSPFSPYYVPEVVVVVMKAESDPESEAADLAVESYLPAEHVYVQMARNFPPKAIEWIRRAKWAGPVWIPWEQIDTAGKKSWAASHETEKVTEFKKQIKEHDGHVSPSVLVRQKDGKSFIVDGHHRALAREEMGQDVLGYIGTVSSPADYDAATEAHSSQLHQGSDPQNKTVEAEPAVRVKVSKESVHYGSGTPFRNCGNCVMYNSGTCDLVLGKIMPGDVCDRWEAE